nr:MAG TPA: hypothetical protein [Caudoviricetes sp.]
MQPLQIFFSKRFFFSCNSVKIMLTYIHQREGITLLQQKTES